MRILIYTHEFVPFAGGVATYSRELATGLAERGQDVFVLAPRYKNLEDLHLTEKHRIKRFRRLKISRFSLVWPMLVFIYTWWRFHPNVVIVAERYAHIIAALSIILFPIKCVPVIHGTEIERHLTANSLIQKLRKKLIEYFFGNSKKIICNSNFTRELLLSRFSIDSKKAKTVYCAVSEFRNFSPASVSSLRQKLSLNKSYKIILTLARLTPRKGQDRVIDSMPKVLAEFPEAKYLVVGDGEYRLDLERKASDLGLLGTSVFFFGRVSEEQVPLYYELCDVFVMPSRADLDGVEGFGISFLEAWRARKPVVAGRHGAVGELVEDCLSGLLVDPENVNEITEAICTLLRDSEFARQLGEAGYQRAKTLFNREIMARKNLEVIKEIVGSREDR